MNSGRRNLLILSFTLLVVMLGYAMVLPIMPFYIENLGAGGKELGWLMATYALMQLIFAPIWGVLSDRYGRKSILSVGILGYAVSMLMFGLSTTFWMLFVARSLSGVRARWSGCGPSSGCATSIRPWRRGLTNAPSR